MYSYDTFTLVEEVWFEFPETLSLVNSGSSDSKIKKKVYDRIISMNTLLCISLLLILLHPEYIQNHIPQSLEVIILLFLLLLTYFLYMFSARLTYNLVQSAQI